MNKPGDVPGARTAEAVHGELEKLFALCPDMLCVVDSDGRVQQANPAMERILGWTAGDLEALTYEDLLHPDDLDAASTSAPVPGSSSTAECRIRCRDGGYKWTKWSFAVSADGRTIYAVGVDTTERKQAEEALRESEERFRRVFEDGPIGMWIVAGDLRTLAVNGALCGMLGYTADELTGRTFADVTHPDDVAEDLAQASRLIGGDIPRYELEKRYLTRSGDTVWVHLTRTAVRNGDGSLRYCLGIVQDLTDHKRTEAELQQRERQLDQAQALARIGTWTWDIRADQVTWSDGLYRLCGLEPGAAPVNYDSYISMVHPEDREMARAAVEDSYRSGRPFGFDHRMVRRDGSDVWTRVWADVVMGEHGPIRMFGTVQDITETKAAEEAIAVFSAIVRSSNAAIVGLTPQGVVTAWNPGAQRLYGYREEEVLGKAVEFLRAPDTGKDPFSWVARVAAGELLEDRETVARRKDGTLLMVSLNAFPIRGRDGAVTGISSIAHDISDRKRAEETLRETHEALASSVTALERRSEEVTLINEMGDLLQSCSALEEVSRVIRKYMRRLLPTDSGTVSVISPSRNHLETVASWGVEPADGTFGPEDCWGLRRGRSYVVESEDEELVCAHVGASPHGGYICIPMMAQGEALGLLHLRADPGGEPCADEASLRRQRLGVAVAEHLSLALANFRLRETLRSQSIRDPLTGLFNRRYMEESLERELRRAARKDTPLAVLAVDVDHFKRFNDTYGHAAGDVVLTSLGRILKDHVRGEDIACRYGGEEFMLILSDCDLESAVARGETLRAAVKAMHVSHRGRRHGGVTISVGVATFPRHGADAASVSMAADVALYAAKAAGRDRVLQAADPAPGGVLREASDPDPDGGPPDVIDPVAPWAAHTPGPEPPVAA